MNPKSSKTVVAGAAVESGGSVAAAPVAPPSWVEATRENLAKVGAETPFQVRDNGVEATVVLNQHDQLVFAEGRHLLPWTPSEMTLSIG